MENFSEKFKKSASFKRSELDYSISREEKALNRVSAKGLTAKMQDYQKSLMSESFIPSSRIQLKSRTKNRFFTVKEGNLDQQSRKNDGINIPLDFSVSLKLTSKPLVLDFPLRTCATDDEQNLGFGNNALNYIKESSDTSEDQQIKEISKSSKNKKKPEKSVKNSKKLKNVEEKCKKNTECNEKSLLKHQKTDSDDEKPIKLVRSESPSKSPLVSNSKTLSKTHFYSFTEALSKFNSLPSEIVDAELWLSGKFERMCLCFLKPVKLSHDFHELCEKLIIFAYSGFDLNNSFHLGLASTVVARLQRLNDEKPGLILSGFSSEDPYSKDLNHDLASVGLLFLLFLSEFIPNTLSHMVNYCISFEIAFVRIAFDVGQLVVIALRKKTLNQVMVKTQKCLETLFFFYAGCISQWFVLHKEFHGDISRTFEELEKQVKKFPMEFIELAWKVIQAQV